MKIEMNTKIIIGIIGILVVGFIGFQILKVQSPEVEKPQKIIKTVRRQITTSPAVKNTPETVVDKTGTNRPQEDINIAPSDRETTPVPERVPTAHSSDAEIREFQAWLFSTLEEEDTIEEIEQEDPNVEDHEIDYELEKSVINSVIEGQWRNSLETHDIEGYMSAIWEDDFFYVSDMDTPDNLSDDIIFRGGSEEREGALRMFDANHTIDLSLSKNRDTEFLSETLAIVDYDYDLKLASTAGGVSNPSGRMIFVLELRESGEWRILEWYDYPTLKP
ncbi:hypothetical protein C6500_20950 [Candidatus Poribacteria bacterium]|nr:MAG: hypothetical protein C6500_20950 [Candidatus Poribacteria bacterium]